MDDEEIIEKLKESCEEEGGTFEKRGFGNYIAMICHLEDGNLPRLINTSSRILRNFKGGKMGKWLKYSIRNTHGNTSSLVFFSIRNRVKVKATFTKEREVDLPLYLIKDPDEWSERLTDLSLKSESSFKEPPFICSSYIEFGHDNVSEKGDSLKVSSVVHCITFTNRRDLIKTARELERIFSMSEEKADELLDDIEPKIRETFDKIEKFEKKPEYKKVGRKSVLIM
ncbi:MAG: hypothetical protein DRN78_03580 [Thermoproteota archaeon]|nr:MAG: hypothetical protein DRN78_03580 [Candidatus Korarchaeota archaeon]